MMFVPRMFEEASVERMHALIAAHPLGALVTSGAGGLAADHLPFELAPPTPDAPLGILRAHVSRANPAWRADGGAALVVFQGPQAYVSPEYYEEKALSGEAVPTWNYAVAHAHGRLRAVHDPAWLLALVERLSARHEAGRPAPWQVADAPRAYIDALLRGVVGIELVVERLEGKCKANQDHSRADRERVADGLARDPATAGMAALMRAGLDA